MKTILLSILLCGYIFLQCTDPHRKSEKTVSDVALKPVKDKSDKLLFGKAGTYHFSNDTINQTIELFFYENEIRFSYEVKNIITGCNRSLSGLAINKNSGGDPELDEDEEGLAYPSVEYIYEDGETRLAIRVAMDGQDKVVIKENSASSSDSGNSCPLESAGTLRTHGTKK